MAQLEAALASCTSPPLKIALYDVAAHAPTVRTATVLLRRLRKEESVARLLGDALSVEVSWNTICSPTFQCVGDASFSMFRLRPFLMLFV
jgi:hypothetical protein